MNVLAKVYTIAGPWKGRLSIIPRPRGGEWLQDEMEALREEGIDIIVSLLTTGEVQELELADEAALARTKGLQFLHYPIPDYSVPSSLPETRAFIEKLDEALTRGENVGIHCRQGIGRSATIASLLLLWWKVPPEEALNRVATARGCSVPDTDEQREWIGKFARYLNASS